MLPTGDMDWPPRDLRSEITRVSDLDAWYGGKLDRLLPNSANVQQSGSRWWPLGKLPRTPGAASGWSDTFPIHIPVAADLARTSADLLFSKLPSLTVSTDSGAPDDMATGRLAEIVDEIDLEARLLESAELCAALSGIYWRVIFDTTRPSAPRVSWIHSDSVWSEWSWGELSAATVVRRLPSPRDDRRIWRHLERHSVQLVEGRPTAVVEHGLYVSTDDGRLGVRVPLTGHPDVAEIAESLTDDDRIEMPGVPMMTMGYVPNMRPNRADRGSPLGRPDIDQLDGALRSIDTTWTSWIRDLRLGRARIIVPRGYLRTESPGAGAVFDEAREVYSELDMIPPSGGSSSGITVSQFAIRTAEHWATLTALVQQVVSSAGYSMRTFGLAGIGGDAVTATQVDSEDSLSEVTRGKKIRYWRPELRRLLAAVLTIDSVILRNGTGQAVMQHQVGVEFAPSAAPSATETAQTASLLAQARAASTDTLVRMVHPDWSDEQVSAEVARIVGETGMPAADPAELGVGGVGL